MVVIPTTEPLAICELNPVSALACPSAEIFSATIEPNAAYADTLKPGDLRARHLNQRRQASYSLGRRCTFRLRVFIRNFTERVQGIRR